MEEIASTDALEREILEDARKKGEKILKDGDAEASRIRIEVAERRVASLATLSEDFRARGERYRNESLARLPLEKGRMKVTFIDRLLRAATGKYLSALSADMVGSLVEGLLSGSRDLVGSSDLKIRYRGMPVETATSIVARVFPEAKDLSFSADEGLVAIGIVASGGKGAIEIKATMDLVGERLLDLYRGELAAALCAEALAL